MQRVSCCHHYQFGDGRESIFSVDFNSIKFGPGALGELPDDVAQFGLRRIGLFTDSVVRNLEPVEQAVVALRKRGIDLEIYDEVSIEPTDKSFQAASRFAAEGKFDGFVSIGGGSVIDTCKAANLYSTYPADFLDYVNAPIGSGIAVPGELAPHIACPTTSGTGSECTGIAVFDFIELKAKTGIASACLKPSKAVIDPNTTATLPSQVVAASGFDVLCHALESYTAKPYTKRTHPANGVRPLSQGANPYSDVGCKEALRLCGEYLLRATNDSSDEQARHGMMLAATLAGIAFGNSGVHLPHAMSYSVAGMVRDYCPDGYPQEHPLVPHGISVIVNAPAAFQYTASAYADRHLEGALLLGESPKHVDRENSGAVLAKTLESMMIATGMPNGLADLGYGETDIEGLSRGAYRQKRLIDNMPCAIDESALADVYSRAVRYW